MSDRKPHIARRLAATLGAMALLLAAEPGLSQGPVPAGPGVSDPPAPAAPLPLAEVASRSTEAANRLAALGTRLAPREESEEIWQSIYQVNHEIDQGLAEIRETLEGQPTLATLQGHQALWRSRQQKLGAWLDVLTKRAVALQDGLKQLSQMEAQWAATREAAEASAAPAATQRQVEAVLAAIETARAHLQGRHDGLLGLQGLISQALNRCDEALTRIATAQRGAVAGILTRKHLSVWSPAQWSQARSSLPARLRAIVAEGRAEVARYLGHPQYEMPLHAGLLVLLTGVFTGLGRLHRRWAADPQTAPPFTAVFTRPLAAALLSTWFVATRFAAATPATVKDLYTALALVPILRLVQPAIPRGLLPAVYALGGFYLLDLFREVLGGTPVVEQVLLLLEGLGGIAVLGWLQASGRLAEALAFVGARVLPRTLATVGRLIVVYVACGVVAGAFGYVRLGRIITPGVVTACALALALFASVRVLGGVAAAALRLWPLQRLQMVRQHRELLERRTHRLLVWAAVMGWVARSLDHIGLLDPVLAALRALLSLTLERGSISISLGDILAFGLTIWASYLVSNFIRFTLQEEVYPRVRIPSGTAYASSRLVHYTILTLGFVMGLGLLGMDLTRVSVLAGALGVGIGFGLQGVVNNVVCGLILLFERPIHVGDTIEVGGLFGEVRRIGFRACTVRTPRGADIIIPNAEFITANVTNWTYSDRLRRIDLPVGVNYASAPKRVIAVLEAVAAANPRVLKVPQPKGLLIGYGDSAINFELRVWTDQSSDYVQVRSDLNAAVYESIQAAGMSFPFPQREVRLLGASAALAPDSTSDPGDAPA